jgi:DNA-binding NarL/FixJ family response regulator
MPTHYHIAIVEHDQYALSMMGMLLARDWRTRAIAELGGDKSLRELGEEVQKLARSRERVDLVIIDAEIPGEPIKPFQIAALFANFSPHPRLLFIDTRINPGFIAKAAAHPDFAGFLLKNEVLFALAAAVVQAVEGNVVITAGVDAALLPGNLERRVQVVGSANPFLGLGPRERDIARLGILYNMAQRDIADELVIEPAYVADVMYNLYEILGLHEIVRGERPPEEVFANPIILRKIQEIVQPAGHGHKAPNMPTLAFHLLTQHGTGS